MVTGDESKLRALQADRIRYLESVIKTIGSCTRKRDVNKVLANHYYGESERRKEAMKLGHAIRKAGGKKKFHTDVKGRSIDVWI